VAQRLDNPTSVSTAVADDKTEEGNGDGRQDADDLTVDDKHEEVE
jgi:hypothetical protein